jgi:septal ring factor EnvC (AmiA/AmiB activator)
MRKSIPTAFLLAISGVFFALVFFFVSGKDTFVSAQDDAGEIQSDISKTEKKLKDAQKKEDALQQDLYQINSSLTSTQQLILKTENLLTQTARTIDQKAEQIANLEQQLGLEKKVLSGLIQEMYFAGNAPLVEVMLAGDDLTSLFRGKDNLLSTQEKMQGVIQEINDMKAKVIDEKLSLEDTKKDHETLLQIKNKQNRRFFP